MTIIDWPQEKVKEGLSVDWKESESIGEVDDGNLFIVRLYDGMDGCWMDITEPVSKEEADRVWNEKTGNGTKKTCYDHIDYYRIFPADTRMIFEME